MLLDLDNFRVRVSALAGDRLRLVLDYPNEEQYRRRVQQALSDLLRPVPPPPSETISSANGSAQDKDA